MVERCAAAKVAGVDEGGAKAAARGLVGNRQAVDAAAYHQQVVRRRAEAREIAWTHAVRFIL
jgi:hypothetical protein